MSALIEKMRGRREQWVKAGKFEFKLRRPTQLEMVKIGRDTVPADLLITHFHDWKNVTENDLVGGGGSSPVPFDREAWGEFIADHADLWVTLLDAFSKSLADYNQQIEDNTKN